VNDTGDKKEKFKETGDKKEKFKEKK